MRSMVTCVVWKPVPLVLGGIKKPWHAAVLEMHLMGIERSMFHGDRFSDRYNQAVGIEYMYKRMGLILCFSMN